MAIDHDQIFKTLVKNFFQEFMELFLPKEAAIIDFSKVEFLEQESFTDIVGGARKEMDLVARVGLKTGGEEYILVHDEFQAKRAPDFSKRMFEYFCLLYLRYQKTIIPIAVFTDDAQWMKPVPDTFDIRLNDRTYVHFEYHLIKLKHFDYRQFLESENPLAFALMAKMNYKRSQRVRLKADFLRWILGAPINPARQSLLLDFVETYIALNRAEETEFEQIIEHKPEYKEVEKMVTTYEKRGIQKGRKEGRTKGRKEALQHSLILLIEKRFGSPDEQIKEQVGRIRSVKKLESLMVQILDAESIDELGL
jgi:predicted transposase/invertase (TIGR01784 family)